MNTSNSVHQARTRGQDQARVRPLHLLFVIAVTALLLAFPAAAGADAARPYDEGYGTAWFADPGEWYVAPDTTVASTPQSVDDYGITWFAHPGEWSVAPDTTAAQASTPQSVDDYGITWFADPGEWSVAPDTTAAQGSTPQSVDDDYGITWFADPGEWCAQC